VRSLLVVSKIIHLLLAMLAPQVRGMCCAARAALAAVRWRAPLAESWLHP
jgi:hypothetical protein